MGPYEIRELTNNDRAALEHFLKPYQDKVMFMLFNMRRGGLTYANKPGQSVFWGVISDKVIYSVLSLTWNGYIQIYAPLYLNELCDKLRKFLIQTGRPVYGINGVPEYVRSAMDNLKLTEPAKKLNNDEALFTLGLENLIDPTTDSSDEICLRPLGKKDAEVLKIWQLGYSIEALGETDTPALRQSIERRIPGLIKNSGGYSRILEINGIPVARTSFSAMLPDAVTVAGVWTDTEFRNKGYARIAVAESLKEVMRKGVKQAVLFTASEPAARAYKALGFQPAGQYSFVLFKKPWTAG